MMVEAFISRPSVTFASPKGLGVLGDEAPSDYDSADLLAEKDVTVDTDVEDAPIRDALKRELLLLASVTNRGEYATKEETRYCH